MGKYSPAICYKNRERMVGTEVPLVGSRKGHLASRLNPEGYAAMTSASHTCEVEGVPRAFRPRGRGPRKEVVGSVFPELAMMTVVMNAVSALCQTCSAPTRGTCVNCSIPTCPRCLYSDKVCADCGLGLTRVVVDGSYETDPDKDITPQSDEVRMINKGIERLNGRGMCYAAALHAHRVRGQAVRSGLPPT